MRNNRTTSHRKIATYWFPWIRCTSAMKYWNFHLQSTELQLPVRSGLLRHLCITWKMARRLWSLRLHLPWESSDFEEDKSLSEDASKQYGLQPYQFEPYAPEKDLLTIAVIRKRRRWTANMAVAWIVSSGEHFCCCFIPFQKKKRRRRKKRKKIQPGKKYPAAF